MQERTSLGRRIDRPPSDSVCGLAMVAQEMRPLSILLLRRDLRDKAQLVKSVRGGERRRNDVLEKGDRSSHDVAISIEMPAERRFSPHGRVHPLDDLQGFNPRPSLLCHRTGREEARARIEQSDPVGRLGDRHG